MPENYLDKKQIAEIFSVSTKTIERWMQDKNGIPFIQPNKNSIVRFVESDCREWFESFSYKKL